MVQVSSKTELDWEGCGSLPGVFAQVTRPTAIELRYIDETGVSSHTPASQVGDRREMKASGLLARVIQHEIDHLDGVMFTDIADPSTLVSSEYYLKHIQGK
ncbi:peptide deformylase [Candidatus Pacebacteria bacterium]|nr:peptide deformylase [Candidatus Paceibacterota bacterium]